jgi:hypothetical protein
MVNEIEVILKLRYIQFHLEHSKFKSEIFSIGYVAWFFTKGSRK